MLNRNQKSNKKLKKETINAYGGKCKCCGEDQLLFLTIEHSKHDGAAHRKKFGGRGGDRIYRDLKKRGFPKDLGIEVLCWNCQRSSFMRQDCPHNSIYGGKT